MTAPRLQDSIDAPNFGRGKKAVHGSSSVNDKSRVRLGQPEGAGGRAMTDPSGSGVSGGGGDPRATARRIADQIAPLIRLARAAKFDFLAYLLAMALKESRRLSGQ